MATHYDHVDDVPLDYCAICGAAPCDKCHQCRRPLNEFGQCEPKCWA